MYKTHRTEGSVVPVAVRHVSPKLPVAAQGRRAGRQSERANVDAHEERGGLSLSVQGPQGAERQQLVLVGATVPSASEEKGDTGGRLMDTNDRGRPTSAPKLPA